MENSEMDKLMAHCSHYFQQGDPIVLHNTDMRDPHVDVLPYELSEAYLLRLTEIFMFETACVKNFTR